MAPASGGWFLEGGLSMPQRITLLGLWVVVGFTGCARDAPTAAEPRNTAELSREELSGLTVAIADVRNRILPTLGSGAAVLALGGALEELEPALSRTEAGAHERALGRGQAAAAQLEAEERFRPDVDVVLLVL